MSYRALCVVAVLSLAGGSIAAGPGDAVMAAWADCQRLPADRQPHVRYFTAYHLDQEKATTAGKVLSFWCNSLSREPDVIRPVQVGPTLWRVDIRDYGWKRETWEKLAAVDPYFHVLGVDATAFEEVKVTERIVHKGGRFRFPNGKVEDFDTPPGTYEAEYTKLVPKQVKGLPQPAPWLPAKEYTALATATGSNLPVARVDWWAYQVCQAKDRVAGYYDWLGIGTKEADYFEALGVDIKLAQKRRKEIAAVVAISGVTLQNRSLERFGLIDGGLWRTHDYKSSTFKQNTIRLLDGDTDPPLGDAHEEYATLQNGLFAYFLANAEGERQDTAPDFIAGDSTSPTPDKRVHVGISCVRCHAEGLRPINDWMRAVHNNERLQLVSPDYKKQQRLNQLYMSDLDGHLETDRRRYAAALIKTNGLTPQENATAAAEVYAAYVGPVTLEIAAAEYGCKPAGLVAGINAQPPGLRDPVLVAFVAVDGQGNPRPLSIRREHFEESYSIGFKYLKGSK